MEWFAEYALPEHDHLLNFIETLRSYYLTQYVTEPTRFREHEEPNILDLNISNEDGMVKDLNYYPLRKVITRLTSVEYNQCKTPFSVEYNQCKTPFSVEYNQCKTPFSVEYNQCKTPFSVEYNQCKTPFSVEYNQCPFKTQIQARHSNLNKTRWFQSNKP